MKLNNTHVSNSCFLPYRGVDSSAGLAVLRAYGDPNVKANLKAAEKALRENLCASLTVRLLQSEK